jgi:hypothetical protein
MPGMANKYRVVKLAPDAYWIEAEGKRVAALKRENSRSRSWDADLLHGVQMRPPFTERTHRFGSFGAAREWLGWPAIIGPETRPEPANRQRKGRG